MAELTQGIIQEIGEIERNEGARVVVTTPSGIMRAQLALSCLVRPVCGDTVLIARHHDVAYILAVLARSADVGTTLQLQGRTTVEVRGDLALHATGALQLQGDTTARVQAPQVEVLGGEAIQLTSGRVSITARALSCLADSLDYTARTIRQSCEQWIAHSRLHQRHTEAVEMVSAGSLDVRADELVTVQARHTIMNSTELTRIDAQQIQMG